ncbi:MAG: 3-hydroxyacyl-CoA dehydrogenase family protein [Fibrobacterota bacterium]
MKKNKINKVAVIGAGDMGHGIAESALLAGYPVYLNDVRQEFIDRGVAGIDFSLKKFLSKGIITQAHYDKINRTLLQTTTDLKTAVREADLVIEAISENLELKRAIFEKLDQYAPNHAILASNSSTIPISLIAKAVKSPNRVLGLHYFNPVVLMKLVEVIRGEKTAPETIQQAYDFILEINKIPVKVAKDTPGFIVNRVQAPGGVLLHCLADTPIATPAEIDALFRNDGAPMGPYETMDYTGLDINYNCMKYFAEAVHPDFAPGKIVTEKVLAGNLGKKTGRGFFDWSNGRPLIDLGKPAGSVDILDFIALEINEASKLIEMKVCSLNDIDLALIHATGRKKGPIETARLQPPEYWQNKLNELADKYHKSIFKPTTLLIQGFYH